STLDLHREIARQLAHSDATLTPSEQRLLDRTLAGLVATLWQTRLLRRQKLTVQDEIDNALTYYTSTFLTASPRLYQDLATRLQPAGRKLFDVQTKPLPAFLQMGSWIGGDRDGNPKVDANTLEQALLRQSTQVLRHYLQEIKLLGTELSLSRLRSSISPGLQELCRMSQDSSTHRTD